MLRQAPYDKIGQTPTPKYTNANPTAGDPGSIPNAETFNQLQFEGENLVALGGLTADGTNLFQWSQAVSRGGIWAGALTGTGDLAVATLPIPNNGAVLPALLQGMRVASIATASNTVTNPKLRVLNLGASQGLYADFPILKQDGSVLSAGDILAGRLYRFEADGAGNVLISGGGLSSGSATSVAQAAKVGFNTQTYLSSTRVSMSQQGVNAVVTPISGLAFTKQSATSLVRAFGTFLVRCPYSPGNGNGPAFFNLVLGSQVVQQATNNGYPNVVNLTPIIAQFGTKASPMPKGTYPFSVQFGRTDAAAWQGAWLANSSDESGYPGASLMQIFLDETEPA